MWIQILGADEKGDNKELEMGRKVEQEHTDTLNWLLKEVNAPAERLEALRTEAIQRIAQDHLKELPDYYTRLKAMESGS
jgi:hypothetical protein